MILYKNLYVCRTDFFMEIRKATLSDIDHIVPLFDGYRLFYRQSSDIEAARTFIKNRLEREESIIYIAFSKDEPQRAIGFTQLYPIFSSVSMEKMLLLNDLFIDPKYRGSGAGTALINKAKERCQDTNQKGLVIQTETTNPAQKLYEHLGFKKDPDLHYFWSAQS